MNVLSLFDGISCGQIALERAEIKVDNYFASEVDKYAIKVTQKNYPNTIQLGDILNWREWNLPKIDLILGGSPCQGFSRSGLKLNWDDPRSRLFFVFSDILHNMAMRNYNLKFLFENVRMKKDIQDLISEELGVDPVRIDSALVSGQGRVRLYWANWKFDQPEDKGILLKDILENGSVDRNKSYTIDANYFKGGSLKNYLEKSRRQVVLRQSEKRLMVKNLSEDIPFRKLTPIECERLQTLPDNYTEGISNTQRYKGLGNGWTVDVIAHILRRLNEQSI
jgi:site-specific DNA-cytosine methylase